ncbi:hypothetical protein [Jiella sp. M17.18]|uniref:hypothetical protein n=1 Tax=Jiella sp. M17.18 TaxID=3234247 RepID=UPI0034DE8F89
MIKSSIIAAAIALALLGSKSGLAQDLASPDIVSPKGNLPLRDSPPGLFKGKGEQLGVVNPDTKYIVIQKKIVPSIFGNEEWLNVQPLENSAQRPAGWVFSGSGDVSNFTFENSSSEK